MIKTKDTTLVFSDIHADITALRTIFECTASDEFTDKFGRVKKLINLGDVVGRGYSPGNVIEFINNLDLEVLSILGNHDESVMYDWPVPGDDIYAEKIHKKFRERGEHWDYFNDLSDHYIDSENSILCVHGGPIHPDSIAPPGLSEYNKWLYQRTWQRLDPANSYYNPYTGFRYTPDMAFEYGKMMLNKRIGEEADNLLMFAGHQHREAVYEKKGGEIKNIHALIKSKIDTITYKNHILCFSEFSIEKEASYLVRLGIAGPIGYSFYTTQFGILCFDGDTKEHKISLIEVDYSKRAEEDIDRIIKDIGRV